MNFYRYLIFVRTHATETSVTGAFSNVAFDRPSSHVSAKLSAAGNVSAVKSRENVSAPRGLLIRSPVASLQYKPITYICSISQTISKYFIHTITFSYCSTPKWRKMIANTQLPWCASNGKISFVSLHSRHSRKRHYPSG